MFPMQIRPEVLKRLREEYPVGCTVELIEMCEPYICQSVTVIKNQNSRFCKVFPHVCLIESAQKSGSAKICLQGGGK